MDPSAVMLVGVDFFGGLRYNGCKLARKAMRLWQEEEKAEGELRVEIRCPVCGAALRREEKAFRCERRHSYDIAKSGYVNLLPPSPAGKRHGDDRRMVAARTDFLSRGYYDHLQTAISETAVALTGERAAVIDAGCGEGAYTRRVFEALRAAGKAAEVVGIDISTEAVRRAARQVPEGIFCAASTAHMPLGDGAADLILNIFSPFMDAEFARVLRQGGYVVRAVPMARHLWELKAAVYEKPYENPPLDLASAQLTLVRREAVCRKIGLRCGADVQNLFQMTPYYYKTGVEDQRKLDGVEQMEVSTEFEIVIYQKEREN